jgi:caa(3)-type oxidase subunit IV
MGGRGYAEQKAHYIKTWAILCGLLLVSIVGPEVGAVTGIAVITLITAFGVAGYKAWLVVKHFMHLTEEPPIIWYILTVCLVFLGMFFAGVSPDVMNHEGTRWENVAAKQAVIDGVAAGEASGGHGHGHGDAHGDDHGEAHGDDHGEAHGKEHDDGHDEKGH